MLQPQQPPLRLVKPPYLDPTGTGLCYCIQAAHRKTAIDLAIAALRGLANDSSEQVFAEMFPFCVPPSAGRDKSFSGIV
jgi:hypothetical protein